MNEIDLETKKYIKEEIEKYFLSTLIKEYAYPRKDFCNNIEKLAPQIIIHWCLIRYARLTNINTRTIQHWKCELSSWCFKLMKMGLKGNDDFKNRANAITNVWDKMDYDKDALAIKFTILSKFREEKFDTNVQEFQQTLNDCIEHADKLIYYIAKKNLKEFDEYINNL